MQRASGAAVRVCVYTDTSCASRWHVASMFIRMKATPVPLRMASSFFRAARVRSFRKARPERMEHNPQLPRVLDWPALVGIMRTRSGRTSLAKHVQPRAGWLVAHGREV